MEGAPTYEDLSIDDQLTQLERVKKYVVSAIPLQRLVHVKLLVETANSIGFEETKEHIVPLLEDRLQDSEQAVRQHLAGQLEGLAKLCVAEGGDEGYDILLSTILKVIAALLVDPKQEVRTAAGTALIAVARLVKTQDLGHCVLTILLQLAHDDEVEEQRMTAAELLDAIAPIMGRDLCKQFIVPEIVSLAEDPVFRVRKSAALSMSNVCATSDETDIVERLLPSFVTLSEDSMHRVRRACAETMGEMAKATPLELRATVLKEILIRLANDTSTIVRVAAWQQLGPFIATLPKEFVSDDLVELFCLLVERNTGNTENDHQLRIHCAYNFPAVLQVLGVENWPTLRPIYMTLVRLPIKPVRRTLAASLHAVAAILGREIVEDELLSVFEEFSQDMEEVRIGLVQHLAEFLEILSETCRCSYLPILKDILQSSNPFNWRLRQQLAKQLPALCRLFSPANVQSSLSSFALLLLNDSVMAVRREAFEGVAVLVCRLAGVPDPTTASSSSASGFDDPAAGATANASTPTTTAESDFEMDQECADKNGDKEGDLLDLVLPQLQAFSTSENYLQRQLWVDLCIVLSTSVPDEVFDRVCLSSILELANDSVSNVRISVAQLLAGAKDSLLAKPEIAEVVRRLADDDVDVVDVLRPLQSRFPDVEFGNGARTRRHENSDF